MIWLTVVPVALCGGPWWATTTLALVAVALPLSRTLISDNERVALAQFYHDAVGKLTAMGLKPAKSGEPHHAT